ncbi:serine hydrolase [Bacillus haynesii]|uniref:Serine hydrolase n=1 Tax=Bacillus haynesii TaxID=1925021 RepID=A0AA90F4W9_9BACI|nr:serine hydrolase [Bacillus haynesii]MCY7789754.1 serine hydrolase [Bacillus haynesii]MCY9226385.1 serine hydrolase [Bacillus haynesii]MCY9281313.1 serine hydrolase [Bacillus haynesii]MCY9390742.1 serine hydrolase [Bacillus haynesii]
MRQPIKELKGFRAFTLEKMNEWNVPGAAVAVIKEDEIIMAEGFGFRDKERKLKVNPETVFAIGSASKAFTTAAMAVLADEGKMEWDKPVREYLPEFKMHDPVATERMTPRDLACHRSGLPRHEMMWYNSSFSREELFRRVRYLEPNLDFRSKWQYQNLMYMTAGYLAGRIAGTTWEDLVYERLFKPLHMTSSSFSVEDMQKLSDFAFPYQEKNGTVEKIPFRNIDVIGPAGSINSNAVDMANWVLLQLGSGKFSGILSEGSLHELHTPCISCDSIIKAKELPVCSYGLGWFVEPYRGRHMIHHGGNIDGFSSLVAFMPYEKIGLVILTNMNGSFLPNVLAYNIFDRLLGLEEIDWSGRLKGETEKIMKAALGVDRTADLTKIEGTTPSHALKDYTGVYENPGYGEIRIELKDGILQALFNSFVMPLKHYHYNIFEMKMPLTEMAMLASFDTDIHGHISRLSIPFEMAEGAREIEFVRKPEQQLYDPEFLASLTGEYALEDGTDVVVSLRNNRTLWVSLPGQPDYELEPYRELTFQIKNLPGFSVRFEAGDSGQVTGLRFIQPNGEFPAVRK